MQKLSRTKIELFTNCPRCFWLDVVQGVKRPFGPPFTINNAVDYLMKQEFDVHRADGTPHPVMVANNIDAVPYQSEHMDKWRHNFTGVQVKYEPTDFLLTGAVDDVWVDKKGTLYVVDYKATGANQHQIYDSYRRQMEIYQWLLSQNGYDVSPTGYFVFAKVNKGEGFGHGHAMLPFDFFIESMVGDGTWIPATLARMRETIDSDTAPNASETCEYCAYRASAERF